MAGYLDQYGAGDERRARKIKIAVVSVVGLAITGGILYFLFHNHSPERQVKRCFQLLAAGDYQAAYVAWGCTEAKPCTGYPMSVFLRDWGPPLNVTGFAILDGESCGNSVIVDVDAGAAGDRKLWVNRGTLEISFPFAPQRMTSYTSSCSRRRSSTSPAMTSGLFCSCWAAVRVLLASSVDKVSSEVRPRLSPASSAPSTLTSNQLSIERETNW